MESGKFSTGVCLVRPPVILPVTTVNAQMGIAPLGLAYLAGSLLREGFPVAVIDSLGEALDSFCSFDVEGLVLQGLSVSEIMERVPAETKIFGLSCMFANEWVYAKRIIEHARIKLPHAFIIIGGEFPTSDYAYLLKNHPEIDCCALGEGEETLLEICRIAEAGKLDDLSAVKGIAWRKEGVPVANPRRERIRDLETIPRPAWHLLPMENYHSRGLGFDTRGKRCMPILASRGCPYQCTFCSSPQMWTTKWNVREVNSLLDEMGDYMRTFRVEHFEFYDLTMIIKKAWIHEFCKEVLSRKMKFTWSLPSGTRTEVLDRETLTMMVAAGCKKISLSPESGSPATLKRIKKHLKPEDILEVANNCHKVGMVAKANIIFGFPGQNLKESFENWFFIVKLAFSGINDVSCFRFAPYPGSELFHALVKSGEIIQDDSYDKFLAFNTVSDLKNNKSWSTFIQDWQISFFMFGGMAIFYSISYLIRPWRFFMMIYRLIRKKPVTMLERVLDAMISYFIQGKKVRNLTPVD